MYPCVWECVKQRRKPRIRVLGRQLKRTETGGFYCRAEHSWGWRGTVGAGAWWEVSIAVAISVRRDTGRDKQQRSGLGGPATIEKRRGPRPSGDKQ